MGGQGICDCECREYEGGLFIYVSVRLGCAGFTMWISEPWCSKCPFANMKKHESHT